MVAGTIGELVCSLSSRGLETVDIRGHLWTLSGWWWLEHEWMIFHFIYGMSSFPLTNSYFYNRGRAQPPTSCGRWCHHLRFWRNMVQVLLIVKHGWDWLGGVTWLSEKKQTYYILTWRKNDDMRVVGCYSELNAPKLDLLPKLLPKQFAPFRVPKPSVPNVACGSHTGTIPGTIPGTVSYDLPQSVLPVSAGEITKMT